MGTLVRMVLHAPGRERAREGARAAFARIADLDAALSDYRETSEVTRVTRAAGGRPVPVGPDLFRLLARGSELWRRSDGAFDVTVLPVTRLWRRTLRTGTWPDPTRHRRALRLVDGGAMGLDAARRTVRLERAGMGIDLGGIAKGYAGDEALRVLRERGLPRALVAVGGDVVAGEAPPGEAGFVVEVAGSEGEAGERLRLRAAAASTSGGDEQWVERDGTRYSHVLDPRTGIGLAGRRRATVVAGEGATADALATAACVLGAARGVALIEATAGAEGTVFEEGVGRRESRGWAGLPRAE